MIKYYFKHEYDYDFKEHYIYPKDLTKSQRKVLLNLNNKLLKVEKEMNPEIAKLTKLGASRVADPNDWVTDFEIECFITFYLNENNPEYDKKYIDNVLVQMRDAPDDDGIIYGWDDDNHSEFQNWDDHPMNKEKHCWLYHSLYDHTKLNFGAMLWIGRIRINLAIEFQKAVSCYETFACLKP